MTFAASHLEPSNVEYVANFGTKGSLPLPPGKKIAIVACMDARLDTFGTTGAHEGDAHHIRNAGGRAADALRSLIISQELLGTREIVIIHHSDCGMLTFKSSELHDLVKKRVPEGEVAALEGMAFLEFSDVDQSIKEDAAFLKNNPFILPETEISGYRYEVETGKLVKVV